MSKDGGEMDTNGTLGGYRLGGLDPVVVQLVAHQGLRQLPQVRLQRP